MQVVRSEACVEAEEGGVNRYDRKAKWAAVDPSLSDAYDRVVRAAEACGQNTESVLFVASKWDPVYWLVKGWSWLRSKLFDTKARRARLEYARAVVALYNQAKSVARTRVVAVYEGDEVAVAGPNDA